MAKRGRKKGKSASRNSFEIKDRREKVSRYMLMGWWHSRIATELGVSRQTITGDVKAIKEAFDKAQIINVTALKQKQLAELEVLKAEAWEAWERSKNVRVTKQGKQTSKGEEKSIRQEDRVGERGFITEIREILDDRAEIVGMAPPKQVNLNDISKRPIDELFGRVAEKLPILAGLLATGGLTPGAGSPQ
jgi:hypothetical protein